MVDEKKTKLEEDVVDAKKIVDAETREMEWDELKNSVGNPPKDEIPTASRSVESAKKKKKLRAVTVKNEKAVAEVETPETPVSPALVQELGTEAWSTSARPPSSGGTGGGSSRVPIVVVSVVAGVLALVVFCGLAFLAGRNSAMKSGYGYGKVAEKAAVPTQEPAKTVADPVDPAKADIIAPTVSTVPKAAARSATRSVKGGPRAGESLSDWESRLRIEGGMPSLNEFATKGLAAYEQLP